MNDIKTLTDRFLAGETTREEEQQLYRAFSSGQVPQELEYLRDMFLDLEAVQEPLAAPKKNRNWMRWAAAACVAAVAVGCWWTLGVNPAVEPQGTVAGQEQLMAVVEPQASVAEPEAEVEVATEEPAAPAKPKARQTTPSPSGGERRAAAAEPNIPQEALERAQRLLEEQRLMAMVEEALESEEVQQMIEDYSRDIIYTVTL